MVAVWIIGLLIVFFGLIIIRGAPYVPSRSIHIAKAFNDLYLLSDQDVLVDLGCGDGVVLREAAKKGARAIGYELNPLLYLIAKLLSRGQLLIEVYLTDIWLATFPDETTVVYYFGIERDKNKLIKKMQSEADRLDRQLKLICYGDMLGEATAERADGAYLLYNFTPLQSAKAQV